jgi:hypothetical protein
MSSTYRIDPLHPDRLVCETCGVAVATVPDDLRADASLTKRQVALDHPELPLALGEHDVLCVFRRAAAEGRGPVFVHLLPREAE